jgi:hypothetical protein
VNKSLLSIDYASKDSKAHFFHLPPLSFLVENYDANDYLKEGDIGFKKPKVVQSAFIPLHLLT